MELKQCFRISCYSQVYWNLSRALKSLMMQARDDFMGPAILAWKPIFQFTDPLDCWVSYSSVSLYIFHHHHLKSSLMHDPDQTFLQMRDSHSWNAIFLPPAAAPSVPCNPVLRRKGALGGHFWWAFSTATWEKKQETWTLEPKSLHRWKL